MKHRTYIQRVTLLFAVLLLMAWNSYAQTGSNTFDNPYQNSVHRYEVDAGIGDEYEWNIYPSSTDADNKTNGIALVARASIGGASTLGVDIDFDDATYAVGDYYLVYSEFSSDNCIARRIKQIDVEANTFEIDASVGTASCNTRTGEVWDNADGDISSRTGETMTIDFDINMSKTDADFYMDSWVIEGKFEVTSGSHSFVASALAVYSGPSNGSASISGDEDNFTLTVLTPDDVDYTSDVVSIRVTIQGDITEDVELTLTLTSGTGYASSGSNYETITDAFFDGSTNFVTVHTRFGIPNTPIISVVQL